MLSKAIASALFCAIFSFPAFAGDAGSVDKCATCVETETNKMKAAARASCEAQGSRTSRDAAINTCMSGKASFIASQAKELCKKTCLVKTDPAPSESGSDIQAAIDAQSEAEKCCNNPGSCAGGLSGSASAMIQQGAMIAAAMAMQQQEGDSSGMQMACQLLQGLGGAMGGGNSGLAGVCYSKISSCKNTARDLRSQYEGQADILSQLSSISSSCESLMSKYQALSAQSTAGGGANAMGNMCGQMSSAQPQSALTPPVPPPCVENPNSPECTSCLADPSAPGCVKPTPDSGAIASKANGNEEGDFPTPNLGGVNGEQPNAMGDPYQSQSADVVPNNSGGAIPQGGSAGGRGDFRGSGGSGGGYNTDVLHNANQTGNGGWSAYASNLNTSASGGGGYSQPVRQPSEGSGYNGMDLKKYLPGQERDPNRMIAGLGSAKPDIGPSSGNLFKRVSDRFKNICDYGRLLGCDVKH